jgi:hypothetical protein
MKTTTLLMMAVALAADAAAADDAGQSRQARQPFLTAHLLEASSAAGRHHNG